jgi:hypothetical protein
MIKRKQLRRGVKGWRMLPNSRSVARPSRWGNPYTLSFDREFEVWTVNDIEYSWVYRPEIGEELWTKEQATRKAVELYREYAIFRLKREPSWLDPLRNLDYIYCYCAEDAPWCHGDVLIGLLEER